MGKWVRYSVGHCPKRSENVGWDNVMEFGEPECIFLEEEAQEH